MCGASNVKKNHDTLVECRKQKCVCAVQCVMRVSCGEQFTRHMLGVDAGRAVGSQSRAARRVCQSRWCALPMCISNSPFSYLHATCTTFSTSSTRSRPGRYPASKLLCLPLFGLCGRRCGSRRISIWISKVSLIAGSSLYNSNYERGECSDVQRNDCVPQSQPTQQRKSRQRPPPFGGQRVQLGRGL